MKNMLNKFLIPGLLAMLFASCQKEPTLTYLDKVDFPPALSVSKNAVVLTPANNDSNVVMFAWPAVTFKIAAPVSYKIQVDVPADTIGSNAWSNAVTIDAGDDVLSKSLTGLELNTLALTKFGLPAGSATTMVVRTIATLDRKVYSNAVAFSVNPYKLVVLKKLYVPGDYQGWNPGGAPTLAEVSGKPEMYEGYVYIPNGGTYQFKMTAQPDWTPTAYGDASGTSGDIIVANYAGGNMSVAAGGYYRLTANLNNNKWTATQTTWSIIGDATPGGWGSDTQLAYDAAAQVWKVTANMTKNGSFKFRANNEWKIDFGVDGNGVLAYADDPFLGYTPNLNNLSVPEDGNYTITLDLHTSGQYTYHLVKN